MSREFRIVNANKNIRTVFSSKKKAIEYIEENNLFPEGDFDEMIIKETTYHRHKVNPPELSIDIKNKLISKI